MSQQSTPRFKAIDLYNQGIIVAIRDPIKILDYEFFKPTMKRGGELMFPELKGYTGRRIDKSLNPWDHGNFEVRVSEYVDGKENVIQDWKVVDYNAPEFTFIDTNAKVRTDKMKWIEDGNGNLVPASNRRRSKFFCTGTVPVYTGEPVFISSVVDGKKTVEYLDQMAVYLKGRVMQDIYRLAAKDEEDFGEAPKILYVQFSVKEGPNGKYVDGVNRIEERLAMASWKKNHEKYPDLLPKPMSDEQLEKVTDKLFGIDEI